MITLFTCSDTHGQLPPLANSSKAIACLHAGDLYDGRDLNKNVQSLRNWFENLSKPLIIVRGNHDLADPAQIFARAHDITGSVYRIAEPLVVAGIGWHGEKYFEVPSEDDLDAICLSLSRQLLRELKPDDRLILLTHYPADHPEFPAPAANVPGGGYCCIGSLIEQFHPLVVIQGHVHERHGLVRHTEIDEGNCLLVHPGPTGKLLHIDVEAGTVAVENAG